jgi:hypothetical protein
MNRTIIFTALAGLFVTGCATTTPDHPPTLAGQPVPNQNLVIDFTKRYNLVCREGQTSRTYQGCRVLGYTGDTVREADGSLSKTYSQFERWLVIRLLDGRRVFLSPSSIAFLEEATGQ